MSVKLCLVIVVLTYVYTCHAETHYELPENIAKLVITRAKKCITATGAKRADLMALNRGDFTKNSPEVKQFIMCMGKELGVVTPDGDVDLDLILEFQHPDWTAADIKKFHDTCVGDAKVSHEDHAFDMYKCYYENTDRVALIPLGDNDK